MTSGEIEAAYDAVTQFAPMMTQLIEGNIPAWIVTFSVLASFALIVFLFEFLASLVSDRA